MDPEEAKTGSRERVESKALSLESKRELEASEQSSKPQTIAARKLDGESFTCLSRRELLKVAPVLALGAFAVPTVQDFLLKKGLGFSDWASALLFRRGHSALLRQCRTHSL